MRTNQLLAMAAMAALLPPADARPYGVRPPHSAAPKKRNAAKRAKRQTASASRARNRR
jgi:hypothetical protein